MNVMEIVFEGQPLLEQNRTGISYYETEILKAMLKCFPQNNYGVDVFTFKNRSKKHKIISKQFADLDIHECSWFSGTIFRMLSLFFPVPYALFFWKKRDITHFCNYSVPFGVRGKKIVTIHDLAFRRYPETIEKRTMRMLKCNLKRSIKRADAVIVDSEFTKAELQNYYDVSKKDVYVVPCGVDIKKFYPESDQKVLDSVKRKYGIHKEYFLYLGTLEPRKNIQGLLSAYELFIKKMKCRKQSAPCLVIAGGKGWMYEEIFQRVEKLSLKKEVIFTGYVDEKDKVALLSGAMIFCFPSFYEGFGMPPMEAMACGTPVLTSKSTSLDEVTGNAACKIDPYNVDEIADALEKLYIDAVFRETLIGKGFDQIKKYSWEKAVQRLYNVYCQINSR